MKRQAFWWVGISFLVGIVGGEVYGVGIETAFALTLALAVAAVFFIENNRTLSVLVILGSIFFLLGNLRAESVLPVRETITDAFVDKKIEAMGTVYGDVEERDGYAYVLLRVLQVSTATTTVDVQGMVLARVPPHPNVSRGDGVVVRGVLSHPKAFATDTGRLFDYAGYLAAEGIGYTMSFATVERTAKGAPTLKGFLAKARASYEHGLSLALQEPQSSLAAGITVGDKQGMPKGLSQAFRDAGLVHIVVLSGYNITIIVSVLFYIFSFAPLSLRVVPAGVVMVLFVLLTGASASVVRAAIMVGVALFAKMHARPQSAGRAILIAVCAMVLHNPRVLLHDPGFQLSVLATMGLVYVQPICTHYLRWVTSRFALREVLTSTCATQLAVLPLVVFLMGRVSLIGVFSNVLVLPFVPFAMLASFIAGLYGMFFEFLAPVVGFPAHIVLSFIIKSAEVAASIPYAVATLPPLSLCALGLSYALAIGGVWLFYRRIEIS